MRIQMGNNWVFLEEKEPGTCRNVIFEVDLNRQEDIVKDQMSNDKRIVLDLLLSYIRK